MINCRFIKLDDKDESISIVWLTLSFSAQVFKSESR